MTEAAPKVLIVDDEPDFVSYLGAWLEDNGYRWCSAADGGEGLSAVERERPDLVLMDLQMPTQTGLQLYRTMQASEWMRRIPVVLITGMTDFHLFSDQCGPLPEPAARIDKPVDLGRLLAVLQRALC